MVFMYEELEIDARKKRLAGQEIEGSLGCRRPRRAKLELRNAEGAFEAVARRPGFAHRHKQRILHRPVANILRGHQLVRRQCRSNDAGCGIVSLERRRETHQAQAGEAGDDAPAETWDSRDHLSSPEFHLFMLARQLSNIGADRQRRKLDGLGATP